MNATITIGPADPYAQIADAEPYDLFVAMVGYESRGSAIVATLPRALLPSIVAYEYQHHQVLAFEENRQVFSGLGATRVPLVESDYQADLAARLDASLVGLAASGEDRPLRIAIDISCMDRDQIGRTLTVLYRHTGHFVADFFYSLAKYTDDLMGSEGLVVVNRAIQGFEGWTTDPTLPVICVVGCGFESQLALAAMETLEPTHSIWLIPNGEDERYDKVVMERNRILMDDSATAPYVYNVLHPYETLLELEATTASLLGQSRVVLVPLGPKIFALECMLTALPHVNNVSVWRLSADDQRTAEDRTATGTVVGLRAGFRTTSVGA